jgi:hypothetical protein
MVPLPLLVEWTEACGAALDRQQDGEAMFWELLEQLDREPRTAFERRAEKD